VVSIRIENVTDEDVAYGRYLTSTAKGSMEHYYFSCHIIASACAESSYSKYRYANQHADDIKTYLKGKKMDDTEISTYGIWDFEDIRIRQAEIDADNLRRTILEGEILVEYLD